MPVLSYADLDSICVTVKAGNPLYTPAAAEWCTDLYYTGCRPSEILDRSLWSYLGGTDYRLQPLKSNNPRFFQASDLTGGLKRFIAGDSNYYSTARYARLKSVFRTTTPSIQVYRDTKPMDLYLFRYRFVKYQRLIGQTDAQIQVTMGWTNLAMVEEYAGAVLVR
jgi:hypothetical protein